MTVPLSYLSDVMEIETVEFDLQRQDQLSGSGDARYWQAELASPLWTAKISLAPGYNEDVKRIAALIRSLDGARVPWLVNDPLSKYPQNDPKGAQFATATVTITTISNRRQLSLAGAPNNFQFVIGDKLSIAWIDGAFDRVAFVEVSADIKATSTGAVIGMMVTPALPAGVIVGMGVTFAKPACKMIVVPDSFSSGSATGPITTGLTLKGMQKK